ncbi:MAG: hypothetical protein KGL53_09650, partial [Elusimicrobia bacterium]|nr:hypothetical protein [Elusimicrobiota bacterium]
MNRIELGLTRMRAASRGPQSAPLAQHLNLWSLRDGVLVGVNLDFSSVYELEPEDAALMDPARAGLFAVQSESFLNSLPPDATLQFLVRVRKGDPEAVEAYRRHALEGGGDALARTIVEKKCAFLSGKFTQRRRAYLFVTSHPAGRKTPMTWLLPAFRRPLKETAEAFHQERLRDHASLEQTVVDRLQGAGVRFRRLSSQEALDLV